MNTVGFAQQRRFFGDYRDLLGRSHPLRREVIEAIATVLRLYNTAVWENRFIVGGVVEQIIGSSARALGFAVRNAGKSNQGYDLQLSGDPVVGISVKGAFAKKQGGTINLINLRKKDGQLTQAEAAKRWSSATIFVIAGVGIGYADHEQIPDLVISTADAIQIKGEDLVSWWRSNPEWLIDADVPVKPKGPTVRVASDAVSLDVFADFSQLGAHWEREI